MDNGDTSADTTPWRNDIEDARSDCKKFLEDADPPYDEVRLEYRELSEPRLWERRGAALEGTDR